MLKPWAKYNTPFFVLYCGSESAEYVKRCKYRRVDQGQDYPQTDKSTIRTYRASLAANIREVARN